MNCCWYGGDPGEEFTAVILAGGLGTRLRGVLADRPKVLAPVAGRPFVFYLLDQLVHLGLRRAVLCTGYQAQQVERALGPRYRTLGLEYSREQQPLGTAGALRLAADRVATPHLLVLNGASFCGGSLAPWLHWHRQSRFPGSLLLVHQENTDRFGRVSLGTDNAILAFEEKRPGLGPGLINAGVYALQRRLLGEIPAQVPLSLEHQVFPRWAAQGLLGGYPIRAPFLDIGVPEAFYQAQDFFGSLDMPTCS